jgi:dCTP diphosphatase
MALAAEVGELCALLRWKTPDQANRLSAGNADHSQILEELGDIGIILLSLCERLGVAMEDVVLKKLETNDERYPVEEARGRAERPK